MDVNTLILYWYYRRSKNRKRKRIHWVHPILRQRQNFGTFHTLMSSLRQDDSKFYTYFRMSEDTFDYLLHKLDTDLRKQDTYMRKAITPEEKLAITIRYLASGLSYEDLYFSYRMGKSTISNIIAEVTQSIWNNLYEEFMPLPNKEEEWEKIASGFNVKANFPHCLGAVDGKHIRLRKPSNSGSVYMNYKDFFSIVLLAVVDSDYQFVYVSVGSYGKESSIFKESSFWKMLKEGRLNIPAPRPLFTDSEVQVPFVIIGDEGFGLHTHLLRPFGGTQLDRDKRIFNYRLTRARRYVECAFGILANKWRILHRPIDLKRETAISVVKACTVLHNLIIKKEGIEFEKEFNFENLPHEVSPSIGSGNSVRNEFMTYFLSEAGSVPWQDNKI